MKSGSDFGDSAGDARWFPGGVVGREVHIKYPTRPEVSMTDPRIVSLAQAKDIPLRARVRFSQFGATLAGRVVGISHDDPMRYDLRLDNGALVPNVPEPEIDAVIDESAPRRQRAMPRRTLDLRSTGP